MGSIYTQREALTRVIKDSISVKQALLENKELLEQLIVVINLFRNAFQNGNKIIFAGNGGSAADAQHLAAEFVSRFEFDRPGLPALSLSTDTSMITAIGNDYGYIKLFERQLQAQAKPGDIFVGITTSGRSKNIIAAFNVCAELGVQSVAFSGAAGVVGSSPDYILRVPSLHTPRIQECHILIGHMICAQVELALFPDFASKKQ